ncbi:MAG: FMN reductase [Proteobacteria bacterium]|nr:MAG: FMN reductase [Pseudomonadota bacterium]
MSTYNVVAVSGNLGAPSRTLTLTQSILDALSRLAPIDATIIELGKVGPLLGQSLNRKHLSADAESVLTAVESADLLVVASPVYRATYTGLFKHLFDLVNHDALVEVPVVLAATGGSERHALVLEHQLRPLFSFFRAHTVPTGIYATDADFDNYRLKSGQIEERINDAVRLAAKLLRSRSVAAPKLRALA